MNSKELSSELESKKESKEKKEVVLKIQLDKKDDDEIYKIYELSDNRLAVELDKCIKIFSLKNFKLITEINNERIESSIELKNKDIALTNYYAVNFYKLSGNDYKFYQKISEKEKIFNIYELKNENLIICIPHRINIYSKDNGEYKILFTLKLSETVGSLLEIKNNILSVFLLSRCGSYCTADYSPYSLQIINFERKKIIELSGGCFSRYDDDEIYYGCKFIIKKDKYLFARYAGSIDIYNIENIDKIKRIFRLNKEGNNFIDYLSLFIGKIRDYDDDNLIELVNNNIYKYDEELKKIVFVKKLNFEFGIEKIIDIKKIKNNKYYVAQNKKELVLIKN